MTKKRVGLILVGALAMGTTIGVLNYDPSLADKEREVFVEVIEMENQFRAWKRAEEERVERERVEKLKALEEEKKRSSKTSNPHYNKYNLTQVSNVSYDKLYSELKNTKLASLTSAFIEAEEKYGVNALFLTSVIALESGWGGSARAIKDNNLSGYAIYSRGSSYSFLSKEECILETARLLGEDYLNPKGKYYNGTSVYDVNKKYSASSDWSSKVDRIARDLKR